MWQHTMKNQSIYYFQINLIVELFEKHGFSPEALVKTAKNPDNVKMIYFVQEAQIPNRHILSVCIDNSCSKICFKFL